MATQFSEKIVKKALEAKPKIRKIDANHFEVTPEGGTKDCTAEHGVYIVAYTRDKSGAVTIESCRDAVTHSQCKGFRFNHGECYHGAVTAIHVLKPILTVRLRHGAPRRKAR
jgi:hypothetical protein